MKRDQEVIDRAASALVESVCSIVDSDEPGKDEALTETFAQYDQFVAKNFGDDIKREPGDGGGVHHHASRVADLLVESGKYPHRAAALDHLLDSRRGQALLTRLKSATATKEKSMSRDSIQKICKDFGPIAVAKLIADDQDPHGLGEHELVELIGNFERQPNESTAKCFTRHYEAHPDVIGKALSIAKRAQFANTLFPYPS